MPLPLLTGEGKRCVFSVIFLAPFPIDLNRRLAENRLQAETT